MAITEYFNQRVDGSHKTVMIISHTDADGVVSAFINTEFAILHSDRDANILTIGAVAPGSDSTMSTFKYGIAKCIEYFGKGFSADEFRIIVCDRDFFTVEDYNLIRNKYGAFTKNLKFYCIDHHATNRFITVPEYQYLMVTNKDINMMVETSKAWSGANLSLRYWESEAENCQEIAERCGRYGLSFDMCRDLATVTKNWDTFTWRDMEEEDQINAQQINSICSVLGPKSMFDAITLAKKNMLGTNNLFFGLEDTRMMCYGSMQNKLQECLDNNLWKMGFEIMNLGTDTIKIGILFGVEVEWQSMFAQRVFEMDKYYDVDVVVFINYYGTVSVRIRQNKECIIDGSELATFARDMFGTSGGGHPNACGFTVDYNEGRKTELGQKVLDVFYGYKNMPSPKFKLNTK